MATNASLSSSFVPQSDAGLTAVYEAQPLNVSTNTNIRLLNLLPSSPTDDPLTIKLGIKVFPLHDTPPYTALSYVWGQDTPSRSVILYGAPVKVRSNLWDFLDRARHDDSIHYLWIDALCIDQSSIAERNHQVTIMGPIFLRAQTVIAWLGAGPPRLLKAFEHLARIDFNSRISVLKQVILFMPPFCDAEYWRRMWTVQEFCLAKTLVIWSGPRAMIGDQFLDYIGEVMFAIKPNNTFNRSHTMRRSFQRDPHGPFNDLPKLLRAVHSNPGRCTDIKDRIYSILTLATGEDFTLFPIVVDYNQTATELFFALADRRFRQLNQGATSESDRLLDLASFLPVVARLLNLTEDTDVVRVYLRIDDLWRTSTATDRDGKRAWQEAKTLCSLQEPVSQLPNYVVRAMEALSLHRQSNSLSRFVKRVLHSS